MSIGKRLEEERKSKGYKSQNALADALGISYPTISRWENDSTAIPSDKCALMAELGLDILYILTGKPATSPGFWGGDIEKTDGYKKNRKKTGDVAGFWGGEVEEAEIDGNGNCIVRLSNGLIFTGAHEDVKQKLDQYKNAIDSDEYAFIPLYDVEVSAGHGALAGFGRIITYLAFRRYSLRKEGLQEAHLSCVLAKGDSMEPTLRPRDTLMIDALQREPDGGIFVLRVDDSLYIKRLMREKDGIRVISDNQIYPEWLLTERDDFEIVGKKVWQARWD